MAKHFYVIQILLDSLFFNDKNETKQEDTSSK